MRKKDYRLNTAINQRLTRNIRKQMAKRGWNAEKLAAEAEVDKSNLSNLFTGKLNYTIQTVEKLCTALDIDISRLFVQKGHL